MDAQTNFNVLLTPELGKFVQTRVASGRYQTASEVVSEGLRLLEVQELDRQTRFNALKARLQAAAEAAERGELFDPQVALDDIEEMKRDRARRTA